MGCDRGLGARLFADEVTMPRQISALGARNAKVVLLHRYDLGWGVGHFRHQVNDHWCRPLTSRWHERENHPPIYLPNGWQFGVATLHLAPGRQQSTEVHLALYDGRQIDFYRMWRNLPETAVAFDSVSRPRWHLDLKTSTNISQYSISEDLGPALMSVERGLALVDTGNLWNLAHIHGVWGEWFTEGVVESGVGARIDTQWLRDFIAECHARSPRVKLGVYTWAWAVHPRSRVYQQHPEWFITRDRSGQVFNAYSNMVLNHARRMGIPESMDELIGQFADVMADFGGDYFYLDGGGGGQNLIDWEHLGCDQDYHYEELYRRIREVARAQGDDKAVWFNARTGPWWDIGYYEGIDQQLHASTWRQSADGLSIVKMRQALDPDQVVVPLYWRTHTLPFFSNYCIGLGITPSRPLGADDFLRKLPYIEAAYETRRMRWLEADLQPDWRVDPDTEIEAYALRHGDCAVLSVIDHRDAAGSATVSADTRGLGLDPQRPVYARVYSMRDIRESWPALPEKMRRQLYRDSGWALDTVARLVDVQVIEAPGDRLELSLPTVQHILTMALLSSSPAGIYSVDGMRANFWGSDVLGASVHAGVEGDTLHLTASVPEGGGEAVVIPPPGRRVESDEVRQVPAHGHRLAIVPLGPGESSLRLQLADAPEVTEGLAPESPEQVAVGESLRLAVPGAEGEAVVTVSREGAILHAGRLPVADGAVELAVPEQVHAGEIEIGVVAQVGGALMRGAAYVQVTGSFTPEIPPWRLPLTGPFTEIEEVDISTKGLHVIGRGTDHHDGRNGPQFAMADPEALRFGGGIADAPVTRYGYGFGGLELERARVLTLRITNTCYDAWTFRRGTPSYHPQYTSTFAGMMVDYHTTEGYTKRVALGLGYINPRRETDRPRWGTAAAPDEFIALTDAIHEGRETTVTLDLARWAPEGWDGRCWIGIGVDNLYPSRRLHAEVVEAADSPEGLEILEGQSVGDLFKIRDYTVARASEAPAIDGRLDDRVWREAQPATDFRLLGTVGSSKQQTRAWAAWDEEALYVAYQCPESEKQQPSLKSEKIWNRDAVDTALDPDGDREDFLQIIIDAAGSAEQFSKGYNGRQVRWDVEHAVGEYEGGWAVEMAVPWSEMGVEPHSGMTFTANFVRYRPYPPVDEMQTWSPMPGPAINDPERFGNFTLE
ncbi:MAG: sugar-binding protein, partial [Armatimonadota bacterium]